MTSAQRQAWDIARTRVARLQPAVAAALVKSFTLVLAALPETEVARLIASGAIERIVTVLLAEAVLDRTTMPFRLAMREAMAKAFRMNVPYLPNAGKIDGSVAVVFDQLNPRVTSALRSLETSVITDVHSSVRDTVRQTIARGLEHRQAPVAIARDVRSIVGLAPKDELAVANFRAMLESGDRAALSRLLRDRRFDATLERALGADGKGLTEAQIETMTNAYRRRAIARNAETISRSATLEAYKLANRESWASAIDRGIVDGDRLMREYIGLDDEKERDTHRALNNQIRRFNEPYSSGQMYPGQDEYNCRCTERFFLARA